MPETNEPKKDASPEKEDSGPFDTWWGKLLGAPVFWGIAVWLYFLLGNMEQSGGSIRVHWLLALVYRLGGRWGAVGLFAVLGLLFLIWGIRHLRTGKD